MVQVEIRQLFLIILNTYSNFAYDDDKVEIWTDILKNVPFELAQRNLRTYIQNPANTFPPHPGALAESPTQRINGPDIPNAEETLQMLKDRERDQAPRQIPEFVRERMKLLGQSSIHTNAATRES